MSRLVLLDTGPIGLATKTAGKPDVDACLAWIQHLQQAEIRLAVPEIARYEVRREVVRARAVGCLGRLDRLHPRMEFLPITSEIMNLASELWAQVRHAGLPTAHDQRLDGDAILAATALAAAHRADEVVIETGNVAHLARFPGVEAREWWTIR